MSFEMTQRGFPGPITDNAVLFGAATGLPDSDPDTFAILLLWDYIQGKTDAIYATAQDLANLEADALLKGGGNWDGEGLQAKSFANASDAQDLVTLSQMQAAVIAGPGLDVELGAIAALTSAADKLPYFTGLGTADLADFPAFGRTLIANASAADARADLGLSVGSTVQAWDADLDQIAAFASTGIAVRTASDVWAQRALVAPAAGFGITNPAGIGGDFTFALTNDLAALEGLGSTGFAVRSAADTWVQRSLTAPAAGLTISNETGVSGNPTFALANDLAALEGLGSTGLAVRSGSDTWLQRSIAGTANEITIANGDGVSGNPTASLPSALTFTGKTVTGGTFASPTAITGLPDPSSAQDAATKAYVDSVAAGLDVKPSVKCATTANITLSGEQTLDGVLTSASRVLVKNQNAPAENGIYLSAAGAWTRVTDMDAWTEVPGAFVFVEEGALYADTGWVCSANTGGTLGSTSITWSQFSGAGTYTAGTGLSLTGTQFAISDVELLAIAGLTSAADRLPYFTGSGTAALATFTSYGRTLAALADASAGRTALQVVIGTDVQAFDADLASLAGASSTNAIYYRSAADTWGPVTIGGLLSFSGGTLNVGDAELTAIAGLTSAADKGIYFTGSGAAALFDLSSAMRTFLTTPNSANWRGVLSDETGTGLAYFQGGDIGTPSAGVLTSCTGLPIATGVSGLGSGVAAFLASASSANLATAVSDETGSGLLVFGTAPTLTGALLTGTTQIQQALLVNGVISPAELTANTDDWAPTGFATASVIRVSTDATRQLSGIAGGAAGRVIALHNVGANALVLMNNVTSTAANRFLLTDDVPLAADQSVLLQYDGTSSRWRMIGGAGASTGSGGGVTVSDTEPPAPNSGDQWYDLETGILFVYVDDGDTEQWIEPGASTGDPDPMTMGKAIAAAIVFG
jgi:hypothetical protein